VYQRHPGGAATVCSTVVLAASKVMRRREAFDFWSGCLGDWMQSCKIHGFI
jgi:hypothetical protein